MTVYLTQKEEKEKEDEEDEEVYDSVVQDERNSLNGEGGRGCSSGDRQRLKTITSVKIINYRSGFKGSGTNEVRTVENTRSDDSKITRNAELRNIDCT